MKVILMNDIENFNNQLNRRSYQMDEISKDFNRQVELLLKSSFSRLKRHEKIVIIGAGNLTDVSLEFLLRFFNEVILTDVDIDSLVRSVNYLRLPNNLRRRVECRRVEYTGFEVNNFFNDFKERLINCRTQEKIMQVIDSLLKGIENYRFLKDDTDVDFIYVSPIYTQLVLQQVISEANYLKDRGYPSHLVEFIKMYMLDKMSEVIDRFNSNLVSCLSDDGELFVLSDIFQLNKDSGFYRRVKNSIRNHSVMEELYEGYKKKYGMGLGDFGLYNLDDKLHQTLSRWLLWPFDNESSFVVKLNIYRNRMEEIL